MLAVAANAHGGDFGSASIVISPSDKSVAEGAVCFGS